MRVCAVRVLEIDEGNVLKLCLYNLQNKCVCTEELVGYTILFLYFIILYFYHKFHFSVCCTRKELIF